ncbi:predicted protein [Pyrenophora tritici-repentis Pt-1C-BFP]|uniref:Uncharacterized protein n=1 Tax=Pyrenophora tritici-repentis (strain Pt-1C-BFP) TaxID=426418 RepID=B2WAG9_PYRTR|nr:uncharacterized protein PTRG_07282 [Pyrenophora tritici-repentis Pt-1C-BFP]EDU50201.1 predicted protein [Pyrenophora tritici-repentis Pt-1C-BFP]
MTFLRKKQNSMQILDATMRKHGLDGNIVVFERSGLSRTWNKENEWMWHAWNGKTLTSEKAAPWL